MMMEFLQFYVSSFWVWAGITVGFWIALACIAYAVGAFVGAIFK